MKVEGNKIVLTKDEARELTIEEEDEGEQGDDTGAQVEDSSELSIEDEFLERVHVILSGLKDSGGVLTIVVEE